MSIRVLRKLQQQANKEPELPPPSSEDETNFASDNDKELVKGTGTFNPFDLLNEQSSEQEEGDVEAEAVVDSEEAAPVKINQGKKKKRRRKKQKANVNNNNNKENDKLQKSEDEQQLTTEIATTSKCAQEAKTTSRSIGQLDAELMKIQLKNLNANYEMQRKFGKRVVKMEYVYILKSKENYSRLIYSNKRGRGKGCLKTTYIVTPRERWPALKKHTLTMKPVDPPFTDSAELKAAQEAKLQWYAFEHDASYRKIQKLFYHAILEVDSDFIITLIRKSPYHVDSLIQLSEICKITEDYALAAELIERALYLLESSLHTSFSLTSGLCRMDYRRQENRGFFIVLFKHAQYLEARACTRTAFELSKLLLSLDSENDPLAVILVIDYYAIRAKHYKWLVDFYKTHNSARNLCQLPNMAYSYAMAEYLLNKEDTTAADEALQYALLMFPSFLCLLLEELNVQPSERVRASAYFTTEQRVQPKSLGQLIDLYLCRAKVIWRQHDLMPWIERNVDKVLDTLNETQYLNHEYHTKRFMRYRNPPRAVLRHVILSDFKEKVPLAPFIANEREPIQMHDPLPPLDGDNRYEL